MTRPAQLAAGTVIFVVVVAAWVFAKMRGIETGELLAFAVPVVGALFLSGPINKAAESAQQAAQQTNGALDARIERGVQAALAKRDAARTRQAQGDVSQGNPLPLGTEPPPSGQPHQALLASRSELHAR